MLQFESKICFMQLELVSKYGYNGELHKVITFDGYILELHRITGRTTFEYQANSSVVQKPVVFIMHGILSSSSIWVLSGPEKGLGMYMYRFKQNCQKLKVYKKTFPSQKKENKKTVYGNMRI